MLVRDLVCAAAGWTLAAFVGFAAGRLPRSFLSDEVGAEGFPRGLALLLAAVSTLIALRALWARRREGAPPRWPLARLTLAFTPPAYFALGVLGLSVIAGLSGDSLLKGLFAGILGFLVATIGTDPCPASRASPSSPRTCSPGFARSS